MHNSGNYFDTQGREIYRDEDIVIHAGNVFRGQVTNGSYEHLVAMRFIGSRFYWIHGENLKVGSAAAFVRAVKHGDFEPISITKLDAERLSSIAIVLDSVGNRRTVDQQIEFLEQQAVARERQPDNAHSRGSLIRT